MNFLINPFLNLFPSSYFWDEDRCALCGAIVHLWSASTASAAENQSTAGLQDTRQPPAVILARGDSCASPVLPGSELIAGADPCKTGQAGYRERIQGGGCLKDKHFWEHQLFPNKFNTWWHNSNLFFPAHQSCEMNVILFMLPRLTTMSFAFTGCPA